MYRQEETKSKRRPRDILCTCVFLINFVLFVVVSCFAFTYGEPSTLVSPPLEQLEDEIYNFDIQEFEILRHDYKWIMLSILAAVVLSTVWFFVIKKLSAFLIYLAAVGGVILVALLGFYLYSISLKYQSFELTLAALLCWIVSFVLVILLLVMREKILFTTRLIHESGKIIQSNLGVLLLTMVFSLLIFGLVALSITVILHLYSIPSETPISLLPITGSGDVIVVYENSGHWMAWFVFFSAIWIKGIIMAMEKYAIAYVTVYQLDLRLRRIPPQSYPLLKGIQYALVYNFGTLAFASLVKGILTLISVVSKYVNNSAERSTTMCGSYLFKLMRVIVSSVADFAVIYSSFNSANFWKSAKQVSTLLKEELATAVVSKLIIHYIFATVQIISACLITLLAIICIEASHEHLSTFVAVAIFFPVFFIFGVVSEAYSTVASTVFLVSLVDKSSPEKRLPESLTLLLQPSSDEV